MEELLTLPIMVMAILAIIFILGLSIFLILIKKLNTKIKNFELHVGKHQWLKIEYK